MCNWSLVKKAEASFFPLKKSYLVSLLQYTIAQRWGMRKEDWASLGRREEGTSYDLDESMCLLLTGMFVAQEEEKKETLG